MDAACDESVQSVCLMWAAQTGKTETVNNVIGYFIDADPAPILMVQPTVELAESWSKERLAPMLRDCSCFEGKITNPRSRDSGNTVLQKTFLGGSIAIVGANAPSGLAGRPRRLVIEDEIDRYPPSAGTEGDPCALAERRTETFWNAVIYKTSTPTLKGLSRIEKEFEQTDKRMWFCPCPRCGEYQTLEWSQVRWPEDEPENAWLECAACNAHLSDSERLKMVRAGEWRATAPFHGKRGYFLNGIVSPFRAKKGYRNRLHQMAAQFLEAKTDKEQLKTWTNTFLANTWDDPSERIDSRDISARVEDYSPDRLPEQVIILTAAVDVQSDRLELEVDGIGLEHETWAVETRKFFGDPEQTEVWSDLSSALQAVYKREDGVELRISCTAIDLGHKPGRVRLFINGCGLARVYGVMGSRAQQGMLVIPRQNKHYRMWTYSVATDLAKDAIFARLRITEPGPRYMHYPRGHGFDEEYFRQLTAEVVRLKYTHGFPKRVYEKIRARNEALDLRVYGLAVLDILKPNFTAIAKTLKGNLKQELPKPTETKEAQPGQPAPPKTQWRRPIGFRKPRGWVNAWR